MAMALPLGAAAAPQLTVTPNEGPTNTIFIVTGTGFAPSTAYYFLVSSQDGKVEIVFEDPITATSAGIIITSIKSLAIFPVGGYVAEISPAHWSVAPSSPAQPSA